MANPGGNVPFGNFNPFANANINLNASVPPRDQQAPNFGPNPFGRANAQRQQNRFAFPNEVEEYVRFQRRALGLPEDPAQAPNAVPPAGNGAGGAGLTTPPPPAQPAQPWQAWLAWLQPPPVAPQDPAAAAPAVNIEVNPPPVQEVGAQPNQDQGAPEAPPPPVILLGRYRNAGTGRPLNVPPMIVLTNFALNLLLHLFIVVGAGSVIAAMVTVIQTAEPLFQFLWRWAVFLAIAVLALWASVPTVLRVLVAFQRALGALIVAVLDALASVLNVTIKWPKAAVVSYTLRRE